MGDVITKETSFTKDQKTTLEKLFGFVKRSKEPNAPPQIQAGYAFSEVIGNTLPESVYVKQDFLVSRRRSNRVTRSTSGWR